MQKVLQTEYGQIRPELGVRPGAGTEHHTVNEERRDREQKRPQEICTQRAIRLENTRERS